MNQTRSNLIIIALFALCIIVSLKHSSNADTPIPQKLIAHEFDLADASGKIIGKMQVTKNNEPKIEINDIFNGRAGSISLEISHGNPIVICSSMSTTNSTATILASNKVRSAIAFIKSNAKTGKSKVSLIGTDTSKIQTIEYKSGHPPVLKFLNSSVKAIPMGSSISASSIQADCPKGYHYECLVCTNGRFIGYVKDGYHEQDGPNGTYLAPDPKISK